MPPRLFSSEQQVPSDTAVLARFKEARTVFDNCDRLREEIWCGQRDGNEQLKQQSHREVKGLHDSLGLPEILGKQESEWSYAQADANIASNRWGNVRPWDHSSLPQPYINASTVPPMTWRPISDFRTQQPFIASQAPTPSTFPDFWHHICSSGSRLIVNLTPLFDTYGDHQMRKSDQYWPDKSSMDAGKGWTIELVKEERHTTREPASSVSQKSPDVSAGSNAAPTTPTQPQPQQGSAAPDIPVGDDWTIVKRILRVRPPPGWKPSNLSSYAEALYDGTGAGPTSPPTDISLDAGGTWDVTLLHVDAWADGKHSSGANFTRLVELVEETQRRLVKASAFPIPPIWVHCSAGIGRTGTLIGGLIARALITSKEPSVLKYPADSIVLLIWKYLRDRRFGMITTPQQAKMISDEILRIRSLQRL